MPSPVYLVNMGHQPQALCSGCGTLCRTMLSNFAQFPKIIWFEHISREIAEQEPERADKFKERALACSNLGKRFAFPLIECPEVKE